MYMYIAWACFGYAVCLSLQVEKGTLLNEVGESMSGFASKVSSEI